MKKTTADRLLEIMRTRDLKQVDILRMCEPYSREFNVKINKNDLSQYVNGKTTPGQFKLTVLAKALNVSEAWLMGFDVPITNKPSVSTNMPDNIIPLPETRSIPLLGDIACGSPVLAAENIEMFIRLDKKIPADFALRCKGDSMINARIFDGDIVYIRQQADVDDGDIAAVLIDNEATLKKVYKYPQKLVLRPCNPMYEDFTYTDEELENITILGKAVAFTSMIK